MCICLSGQFELQKKKLVWKRNIFSKIGMLYYLYEHANQNAGIGQLIHVLPRVDSGWWWMPATWPRGQNFCLHHGICYINLQDNGGPSADRAKGGLAIALQTVESCGRDSQDNNFRGGHIVSPVWHNHVIGCHGLKKNIPREEICQGLLAWHAAALPVWLHFLNRGSTRKPSIPYLY